MMLDILFGWRKASRCKELIRCVRCRLKLLRNKRDAIIKHLRSDIAQLLDTGQQQSVLFRVEQLFKDQSILVAYDLLDHFCEFIIINLPYIRRHRDCPNDIKEAVSTLIFAAARCADLPKLQTLRKLFGEHYVNDFAMGAVEFFASLSTMKFLFSLLLHGVMETSYLYSRNNLEIIEFIAMNMLA